MAKVVAKSKSQEEFMSSLKKETNEMKEKEYTFGRDDSNDVYFDHQVEFDAEDLEIDQSGTVNYFAKGEEISNKTYLVSPFTYKNAVNFIDIQKIKKIDSNKEYLMQFEKFDTERHSKEDVNKYDTNFCHHQEELRNLIGQLGHDQLNVLKLVAAHFHNLPLTKTKINPHGQLRLFLSGSAGTGKSRLIECIKLYTLMVFGYNHTKHGPVLIAASTGIAAIGINGQTIDSLLYFYKYDGRELDEFFIRKLQDEIGAGKIIMVDEISMLGCTKFGKLDAILRIATGKYDQLLGGMHFIYSGDFFQLEPVLDNVVYSDPKSWTNCNELKIRGHEVYINTTLYYELTKVFRQPDVIFSEVLNRIRKRNSK